MKFDAEKYTHEADRAALNALKAIPGFSALLKAFMNVWNERQQRILNMSSRIRIGENQMRKYYDMLPPICGKLGIPVPELYLEMNVVPNAYTSGDNNPFIVMTSGLLKAVPEELIPTVLAHECGHIACHHVLYLTMGRIVLQGAGSVLSSTMRFGGLLTVPLQLAFYYWMRCSEFSADRVAVLCDGTDRKMQEVCMRMAGWDKEIDAEVSLDAFLDQASGYQEMIGESKWNKALEQLILSQATHPLTAVRAVECRNWFRSPEFLEAQNPALPDLAEITLPGPAAYGEAEPAERKPYRNEPVIMPEDYRVLASKPTDPKDSVVYGRVTTQSNNFIQVYPISGEEAFCFRGQEEMIGEVRAALSDDEGLIGAGRGTTAKGLAYACCITKAVRDPRSTEYKVTMHIDTPEAPTAVVGYFMEIGSPGFREAAVMGQLKRSDPDADVAATWRRDPFDPTFTRGALMNESEKEQYDSRFPLHPLTEARGFIRELAALN